MLIEIHVLQNHAPSNLNRDDTGSPKEAVFGGVKRARISSQCLKRSVRRSDVFRDALGGDLATRTRRLPELVRERLLAGGLDAAMVDIAVAKASGFGTKDGKERDTAETAQTMFLTDHDVEAVVAVLKAAAEKAGTPAAFKKVEAKVLQTEARQNGFRPLTVDVALFGRMTTSEAFRDVEASMQVAHALSTHKVDHEFDYYTAVDDLQGSSDGEEDSGADMIGDVEYNSACYYKYFSVNVRGLVDNLTGARPFKRTAPAAELTEAKDLAARTLEAFVRAAVLTTPTGKQNTFAAHQLPALVLVEVRPHSTPVSYANAFVDPARTGRAGDLVSASIAKLADHVKALTAGFNLEAEQRLLLAPEHPDARIEGVERVADLAGLCKRLGAAVRHG